MSVQAIRAMQSAMRLQAAMLNMLPAHRAEALMLLDSFCGKVDALISVAGRPEVAMVKDVIDRAAAEG